MATVKDKAAAEAFVELLIGSPTVGCDNDGNEYQGAPHNPTIHAHLAAALGETLPIVAWRLFRAQRADVEAPKAKALAEYLRSVADHLAPSIEP